MEPVVGIFVSRKDAAEASVRLRSQGFAPERVQLLLPSTPHAEDVIPTEDAEQSGVGQAVGGVVGGAMGASAGLGLGAVAASLLVPGVGAVTAVGLAAAALFGAGGAVGGAALGGALEEKSREGLPRDEAYLYEDALEAGPLDRLCDPRIGGGRTDREAGPGGVRGASPSTRRARPGGSVSAIPSGPTTRRPAPSSVRRKKRTGTASSPRCIRRTAARSTPFARPRYARGTASSRTPSDFRRGYERGLAHGDDVATPPAAASGTRSSREAEAARRDERRRLRRSFAMKARDPRRGPRGTSRGRSRIPRGSTCRRRSARRG